MEAKQTPGPWEWATGDDGEYVFLKGDGVYVLSPESEQTHAGLTSWEWVDISDANARLIAAAPALYEALEPFGDIDGEGDEDFADDTPVTVTFGRSTNYTLTLGHLRRARQALSLVEGK